MLERDELLAEAFVVLVGHVDAKYPWRRDALYREYGTAEFFPTRGESAEPAREVCGRCPVSVECAEYTDGLPVPESRVGVWAGTTGVTGASSEDLTASRPDSLRRLSRLDLAAPDVLHSDG